jgi:hypothetical protein
MHSIHQALRSAVATAALAFVTTGAFAAPVVVSAQLVGDPRPGNPDNLIIDVTISFDDTSNVANWVVDINSPLHPNAKLDEFYFNMVGAGANYTFGGFNPAGWNVVSPATSAGGGNIAFLFEALDPAGPPNAADVTNTQNLSFTMTKTVGGLLTLDDFLDSASTCSNDQTLGCGQLGAHLQSLTVAGGSGLSDSGFLLGNYEDGTPSTEVPEPGTVLLTGLALLGLAASRKRKQA